METKELVYITRYSKKLNAGEGDLSVLSKEEREHLKLLIRKYEIEQSLVKMADKLSQGTLL